MGVTQAQIIEDRERRAKAIADARAINATAHAEGRDLTADESAKVDAHLADAERIRKHYEREEQIRASEAAMATRGRVTEPDPLERRRLDADDTLIDDVVSEDKLLAEGREFLAEAFPQARSVADLQAAASGRKLPPAVLAKPWSRQEVLRGTQSYREAFWRAQTVGERGVSPRQARLLGEVNADMQVDNDQQGGVLVMPMQTVDGVIKALDKIIAVRQFATVIPVRGSRALGVRKRTSKASTYARGSELATPNKDVSLKYGTKELMPSDWSAEIDVSRNLLLQSALSVETEFLRELEIDINEAKAAEYATGAGGATSPLGLFVNSTDGISSARDISTDNTTTAVTLKGLKNAKWSQVRYLGQRPRWGGHPDLFAGVDKLESGGTGELIWRTSAREGEPDVLLGLPVFYDESFPNTFTTGLYVGIIGVFGWYWIAVSLDMTVQRLNELLARANQIGFIVRGKDDAMPVLEEPFSRIKLA